MRGARVSLLCDFGEVGKGAWSQGSAGRPAPKQIWTNPCAGGTIERW